MFSGNTSFTVFIIALSVTSLQCAKRFPRTSSSTCSDTWSGTVQYGVTSKSTYINGSAVDGDCSYFTAGYSDANTINGVTKTGLTDVTLIKYDNTGTALWTKRLGASSQVVYGNAMALDSDGSAYVTGLTTGSVDGQAMTGNQDLITVKYDTNGNKQWTRMLGAAGVDTFGYAAAVDSNDNLIVAGQTWGNLDSNTLVGSTDIFLTKYTKTGTKMWTKTLGAAGGGYGYASGAAIGDNDDIYLAGYINRGLNGETLLGTLDAYLAKYNSSGTLQWVRHTGQASKSTMAWGLSVDPDGNIVTFGFTEGNLGNTLAGVQDFFVQKYNPSGTRLWIRQLGNTGGSALAYFNSTSIDPDGNIYVGGYIDSNLDGNTLTGTGNGVIIKYDTDGTKQWTRMFGATTNNTYLTALSVNLAGTIFAAGYTEGSFPGHTLTGLTDSFIVTFDSDGNRN